mgnify:FL=1
MIPAGVVIELELFLESFNRVLMSFVDNTFVKPRVQCVQYGVCDIVTVLRTVDYWFVVEMKNDANQFHLDTETHKNPLVSRSNAVESTGVDGSDGWEISPIPTQAFRPPNSMNLLGVEGSHLPVVDLRLFNGLLAAD